VPRAWWRAQASDEESQDLVADGDGRLLRRERRGSLVWCAFRAHVKGALRSALDEKLAPEVESYGTSKNLAQEGVPTF
jgi:hypothetical protein